MIRLLLLKFWPALIPLVLFALLVWWRYRKLRALEQEVLPPPNATARAALRGWHYAVIAGLLVMIVLQLWFGFSRPADEFRGGSYQPKQLIDGQLVPGHLEKQ